MNRTSFAALLLVAVAVLPSCKKKKTKGYNDIDISEAKARAALFEPTLAVMKKIPASPPPVTKTYGPNDAWIGDPRTPGTDPTPNEWLLVHAEDLATPGYYAKDAVKVRIDETGVFSGCASSVAELKTTTDTFVHKYTLASCTKFKYAYVIRTTEYVPPKTVGGSDETVGKTRKIVENLIPGRSSGEVTIYSLKDGSVVGGFKYTGTNSAQPSMEGGFVGAVDRDLAKETNRAFRDASANKNKPAAPTAKAIPAKK